MKLKTSNCYKTKKTQTVTKLNNSKCNQTYIVIKLKNSNCDKTQKLKLQQNLKYDKSQFMRRKNFKKVLKYYYFDTLTTDEMFSGQRFAILAMFCIKDSKVFMYFY